MSRTRGTPVLKGRDERFDRGPFGICQIGFISARRSSIFFLSGLVQNHADLPVWCGGHWEVPHLGRPLNFQVKLQGMPPPVQANLPDRRLRVANAGANELPQLDCRCKAD